MTLHTPFRDSGASRYCGPTAIMCVTGLRGSEVRDAIRQARGDIRTASGASKSVMGLSNKDLLATMALLGWSAVEQFDAPKYKTVQTPDPKGKWHDGKGGRFTYRRTWPDGFKPLPFADFLHERGADGPFIVNVTGHYMAVSQGEVCDAASTVLPTEIERYLKRGKFGYRQSWVHHWWKFEQAVAA